MNEEEFLKRIEEVPPFDEEELESLFYFDDINICGELVFEEEGSIQRWSHSAIKVYKIANRFFAFYAELGNTEMQDNYFWAQPEEVKPVEKLVIDYVPIKEGED